MQKCNGIWYIKLMEAILLIAGIGFIILLISKAVNQGSTVSNSSESNSAETFIAESQARAIAADSDTYVRKRMTIELKGVGPYFDRDEAFDEVEEGDEVFLEWDTNNEYDSDAIGCYTKSGLLIGYLPAGRYKIIETFYSSIFLARVFKKWIEPSSDYGEFYRMKITMWMGYEKEEIEEIKAKWR